MKPNQEELLFQLALTKSVADRVAWLDRECGDDKGLRARLDALLVAHEQPETLLATDASSGLRRDELHESPIKDRGLTELGPREDEAVGQTLGRYKLLERVGEGGCGVVYVAEHIRTSPRCSTRARPIEIDCLSLLMVKEFLWKLTQGPRPSVKPIGFGDSLRNNSPHSGCHPVPKTRQRNFAPISAMRC